MKITVTITVTAIVIFGGKKYIRHKFRIRQSILKIMPRRAKRNDVRYEEVLRNWAHEVFSYLTWN